MATLTTNINLLQPSGFKVTIDRKNYPNLEFFAQAVTHPGMVGDAPQEYYRGMRLPGVSSALTFADLQMQLLVDEDMNSYTEVKDWLFRLINDEESPRNQGGIPNRCDVQVSILTSHNNINKSIVYYDAFPVDIGDIQLETTLGETNFITVPVTFRYSRFEIT